jgi:hypothetical protein
MTKYCHVCEAEYQDSSTHCVEDKAKLSDEPPSHPLADASFVAFYAASNDLEARRVVAILQDESIEAMARETTSTVFPGASGLRFLVLVPAEQRTACAKMVQQAINDEVLSDEGSYIAG